MKRIIPLVLLSLLAGCAALRPPALTADNSPAWHPNGIAPIRFGGAFTSWQYVDCAPSIQCTANGPINTHTGDPAYFAFYKFNTDVAQISQMFGASSHFATSGSVNSSDIIGLWSGCSSTDPVLGYTGSCVAGGSGGAFSALTSGTNTAAAMLVGSGASLNFTGSGTINASSLGGATFAAPGAIGGTTAGAATFTTLTSTGATVLDGSTVPASAGTLIGTGNLGTGVDTALGVAVGSAGAFVVNGGALGTPSSGTLTNATGLPFSAIAGATNTTGAMLVGTGASLGPTGTGTVNANEANGGAFPSSANVLGTNSLSQPVAATAAQVLALVNNQTCNPQTGTTYTFALTDANNCVTMSNTAANTVTVPANASVAFAVGTTLTVVQVNTGTTTIQGAGSPVTLQSLKYGSSTTQTYAMAGEYDCISLQKTATDTWFVSACSYDPGGGSGTVTDGSGTTTANELAVSTTTAHVLGYAATLPTAAMPALTGDVTGTAGSLSLTVAKVNGAAVPASATVLGSNASSQLVADTTVTYLVDTGTAFTLGTGTGACATDSVVAAGAANGEVTCTGTTGASTLVVNLPTATHGWACSASDITQKTTLPESAFTTTSATVSGSVTASDDIVLACTGF